MKGRPSRRSWTRGAWISSPPAAVVPSAATRCHCGRQSTSGFVALIGVPSEVFIHLRSRRTEREHLDSLGSHCPALGRRERPMSKQRRLTARDAQQPELCPFGVAAQPA